MRARLPAGLDILRDRIRALEQGGRNTTGVLPFGVKDLDRHLPSGGLSLGAVHEIAGGGEEAVDGAAAALFAAGIAARRPGQVLWCVTRPDLFAPALRQAGLGPDRVIYVEAGDEPSLLACFEEGLRHPGLAAVVAETARLSLVASRRLQLAAEDSGGLGLAVRRWRRASEAADFGQHTASATRWRISPAPSSPLTRRAAVFQWAVCPSSTDQPAREAATLSLILSAAARTGSSARWAYRLVVLT